MATNTPPWQPRKRRPEHLHVLRLYFAGMTQVDIARVTGYTPQHVGNIVNLPESEEILRELERKTIDTILDVQADAQAIAPVIFEEKIRLALHSADERVRNVACSDILAIAGHQPVKRVQVENIDRGAEDSYEGLSEEEMRAKLIAETMKLPLNVAEDIDKKTTVH